MRYIVVILLMIDCNLMADAKAAQAPKPPQNMAVSLLPNPPIPKVEPIKKAPCSPACTCGCNEGLPCNCNSPSHPTKIHVIPANITPVGPFYQPAIQYQPNMIQYQASPSYSIPSQRVMPIMRSPTYTGGSTGRASGGC